MATKGRDVELGIEVSTTGSAEIRELEQRVRDLAKEGTAAAPAFDKLADEISRLGDQTQALEGFSKIEDELNALIVAQRRAADTSADLGSKLTALQQVTQLTAQAQDKARAALEAEQAVLRTNKDAKEQLRIETLKLGGATDETRAKSAQLSQEILNSSQRVRALKDAYTEAAGATRTAATEEATLAKQFDKSSAAAQKLRDDLAGRNAALLESRNALSATGVATDNLSASQFKLVEALARSENEMNRLLQTERDAIEAAKAHAREEERLALIVQNSRRAQAEAARAEADGVLRDYARMEQAQRDAAASAKAAGQAIDTALRTVGVRAAQEIEREIQEVRVAMDLLKTSGTLTGANLNQAFAQGTRRIKELELQLRQTTGQMTLIDKTTRLFSGALGQITVGNLAADAIGTLVEKVKDLGREFIGVIVQMDGVKKGLTAVYGSSQVAASQIEFLRAASQKAGVSMSGITDSFVRFSAATKSANIPIGVTNELFAGVTRAGATLGLSTDKVTHALDALGQMASKGVVSMEELRQQLGDSLPGALSLAAKGFGITDQQLIALVETGQLATKDFFPAFTEGLKSLQGDTDSLQGAWGRLKTAFSTTAEAIGDSGWTEVMRLGLEGIRFVLGAVIVPLSAFAETVIGVTKATGDFTLALIQLKNPFTTFPKILEDAAVRQEKLRQVFFGTTTAANTQSEAMAINAAALKGNTSAVLEIIAAQQKQIASTAGATQSALAAAQANVRILLASAENTKAIEANIVASGNLVRAKELEGKAQVQIAQLTGDANTVLLASQKAAEGNATAAGLLVRAHENEVTATQNLIAQRKAMASANSGLDESQKALIAGLEKTLQVQSSTLEKSREARSESEALVASNRLAAESYKDNSSEIEKYKLAADLLIAQMPLLQRAAGSVTDEIERQRAAIARGEGSQVALTAAQVAARPALDALAQANQRLAAFQGLVADGQADLAVKMALATQAKSADLQMSLALVNASKGQYDALAKEALARGDTAQATYYSIEAKRREIEITKLNIELKKLEANAEIAALEVRKADLKISDPLYENKVKELDIRIKLQKIKLLEADAGKELVKAYESEISSMLNNANTRSSTTGGIDRDTASRHSNASAIDKQTSALERQASVQKLTSDGFAANKDGSAAGGFNNNLPMDKIFALKDKTARGGSANLTIDDEALANEALFQAKAAKAYTDDKLSRNAGSVSTAALRDSQAAVVGAQAAVDRIKQLKQDKAAGVGGGTAGFNNTTHTVNLNLGGRSTQVGVASQQDAQNLTGFLRTLESSAGTAT